MNLSSRKYVKHDPRGFNYTIEFIGLHTVRMNLQTNDDMYIMEKHLEEMKLYPKNILGSILPTMEVEKLAGVIMNTHTELKTFLEKLLDLEFDLDSFIKN
jgi:hypothetical protein